MPQRDDAGPWVEEVIPEGENDDDGITDFFGTVHGTADGEEDAEGDDDEGSSSSSSDDGSPAKPSSKGTSSEVASRNIRGFPLCLACLMPESIKWENGLCNGRQYDIVFMFS